MRFWHTWNSEEKSLWTRIHQEGTSKLTPEDASEVKAMEFNLFARPLTDSEISRINYLMDQPLAAVLSQESGAGR